MRALLVLALLLSPMMAWAGFTINDEDGALTLLENGKAVLTYNYELVDPPEDVDEVYRRACYVHPLYGLDGEVLTQDFPRDHYHHRGIFWAWPDSMLGERPINEWLMTDVRQHHVKFTALEVGTEQAVIATENVWLYDDAPDAPKMRETYHITIHAAEGDTRAIDFDCSFTNISDEVLSLRGAITEDKASGLPKGYGGFCLRTPYQKRGKDDGITFTAKDGEVLEDKLYIETPWTDVTFFVDEDKEKRAGVAIFQHQDNPGYPQHGWILRHYGFLGQSYPHRTPLDMKPGDSFNLKYRMLVHRGDAENAKVEEAFSSYSGK